ncbi:MAG TPA: MarR family transcriptional regulator [Kribbella sp.]|nr:MarR family transcriptional regulator [Kribbella sp.]
MSGFMEVFSRASKVMRAVTETALRRHGLYLGQNRVLAALWAEDGQTPGAIAAALNVTTPTVVVMATRMATAGLITRRRDDPDNRLVRLYLTDAGRALQQPVEEELRRIEQHVTAGLTAAERRALTKALEKLTENALTLVSEPIGETG